MSFLNYKLTAVKLCICFMTIHFAAISQVVYVNDSSYLKAVSSTDKDNLERFKFSKPDTTINNFQNYFPRNTNGNVGLPSAPLFLKIRKPFTGI